MKQQDGGIYLTEGDPEFPVAVFLSGADCFVNQDSVVSTTVVPTKRIGTVDILRRHPHGVREILTGIRKARNI